MMKRLLPLLPLLIATACALATTSQAGAATLPDGQQLLLGKTGLRLLDSAGRERASLPLRGKYLDQRSDGPGAALAVVLDADTQAVRPVRVDLARGTLTMSPALTEPAFSVEALCLYRDGQGLAHAFIVGKDGITEQWVFNAQVARMLRRISLPAGTEACRVDDASHTLFITEPGVGEWAYDVAGETNPTRRLLAASAKGAKTAAGAAARPGAMALPARAAAALPAFPMATVLPRAQTEPVARFGDAADDPAIWVHPSDATASRVLGTNKKQGLLVYDLQGRQTQLLEVGRLNNVDVRQRVRFSGAPGEPPVDLAVATQRDRNSVMVFAIDAQGAVTVAGDLPTDLKEIYGICLHQPPAGGLHVFVNDKDGRYQQHALQRNGSSYSATLVRSFKVAGQPEGCVADDPRGRVFIGEERRGVWVTGTDPSVPARLQEVIKVGPVLVADVEGLALHHGPRGSYLVVSSQGNNSYVVLDAAPPYAVRGRFRIGLDLAAGIDGVSETDGLEVSSVNFGGPYGRGLLVVQDGYKRMPEAPQNFKYVAWEDVARALKLSD
jgi:3-phytase